jgi:benzoyl-CoA reductase/2-hydroxyglutaryl-CoA dehydratase subunit BcrC/BadD/HgdB
VKALDNLKLSELFDNLRARTRAFVEVNVVGNAALSAQRLRGEIKQRVPGWWKHEHLAPPLTTSPRLKQLISRHYLAGRHADAHGKVAWVTSGAPVEFLKALGFHLHYPENHGAVCGIRRVGETLCTAAEDEGYSRDICSYARTDFGMVHSGETPVGRVAPPNLLVCCTNICQTVLYWYQVLAEHFDVPLVLIDTPFVYDEAGEHALSYVEEQLSEAIETAERVAGESLAPKKLERVLELSQQAVQLWLEVIERGQHRPSPITAFDEFIHMAPIVEMRGEQFTVDYYRALAAALDERIDKGVGALKQERKRLIWDNLPIWYQVRPLAEQLAEHGVALVASTYTNAWGELAALIDPSKPLASMARVYTYPILNRGTGHKLNTMKRMIESYSVDGVLLHSDRSCKPYSIGQIDQQQRLAEDIGVPALLLEADHNDPRAFADEQSRTRIAAFIEMLS